MKRLFPRCPFFFRKPLHKLLTACLAGAAHLASAQGMHFSQYYHAPLLLNPANTALLPDASYRVGVHYRQQWASIPVPYTTVSGFGEFQVLRGLEGNNWLGVGLAFWDDKAGAGQLQQTRGDLSLAYHLQLGETHMLSLGASVGTVQRKVDFTKFVFDQQWDGFKFDTRLATGEVAELRKSNYLDVGLGMNYAFFPSEKFYLKLGAGVAHLNRPQESFYSMNNRLGLRPTGNVDALIQVSPTVILNPSAYYTTQQGAYELVFGTLFNTRVAGDAKIGSLILGGYHRWKDAVIGVVGYQFGDLRITSSYDYTLSALKPATNGKGAFEISLLYQGKYPNALDRNKFNCPRF